MAENIVHKMKIGNIEYKLRDEDTFAIANSPVPTDNVVYSEEKDLLSTILDTYILNIDYSAIASNPIKEER